MPILATGWIDSPVIVGEGGELRFGNGLCGPSRRADSAGFTLIELLVALIVVGIVVSYAVLSIGDGGRGRQMELEAQRIAALVRLCSDEAVLQSREMGLEFAPEGYRFVWLNREAAAWQPLGGDQILRPRKLPHGFELELLLEGMPVGLDGGESGEVTPHVYVLSSGELTPFELRLKDLNTSSYYTITGRFMGEVAVEGPIER